MIPTEASRHTDIDWAVQTAVLYPSWPQTKSSNLIDVWNGKDVLFLHGFLDELHKLGFWWLDPDQSWPDPIRIHFCVWWSFKAITQEDIRSGSWKSTSPKENGCHQLSSPISEFCFSRFLSILKFSVEKANVTLQVKVIPNTTLTFLATRTPSRFEWWSSWI